MKISLECLLISVTLYSTLLIYHSFTFSPDFQPTSTSSIKQQIQSDSQSLNSNSFAPIILPQAPEITCKLNPNKFTPEEIESIYKYKTYGDCQVPGNDTVEYKNRILSVTCENPNATQYFYKLEEPLYGASRKKGAVVWTMTPPTDQKLEFVMVKCSKKSVHTLVYNRYKKSVESSANAKRAKLSPNGTQMNVLILTLDEVSKYSAERNLPSVVEFLKNLQNDEEFSDYFSNYEFIRPGLTAPYTGTNLAEIIYGERINKLLGTNPNINLKRQPIPFNDTSFRKNALWNFYSDLGYTTMFLHDTAMDFVSPLIGTTVNCDHVFTNLWKYTWTVYGWKDNLNCQRCAGTRNSHVITFDYTYQYFNNYKNNNKFAYVHLNGAHEYSGNVRTMNKDLIVFMKEYLRLIKSRGEDLAFWLIGDHGQKKMDVQFDYRMLFEANVPMTHLILSKNVEETWNLKETLEYNQDKLFSRFDFHIALKQLAYFPYNLTVDLESLNTYNITNAHSLISVRLRPDRTCEDIGSGREFCVCSWFEAVENNKREEIVKEVLFKLVKEYFEDKSQKKLSCEALEGFQIVQVSSFRLKELKFGFDTLYKMELWNGKNRIEVSANFCMKNIIVATQNIISRGLHPFEFFNIPEGRAFMQVTKVETDDQCVKDICVCRPPIEVKALG